MTFFQSKDFSLTNTVLPNTVYKDKTYGFGVFVCAVSRPKSPAYVSANGTNKVTCTVVDPTYGDIDKFDSFRNSENVNEYIHNRKDYKNTIVMYKVSTLLDNQVKFMPLLKFLENYDKVIGYTKDGFMLTERMFNDLRFNENTK